MCKIQRFAEKCCMKNLQIMENRKKQEKEVFSSDFMRITQHAIEREIREIAHQFQNKRLCKSCLMIPSIYLIIYFHQIMCILTSISRDLSYNKELGGPLPASIVDLKKLKSLILDNNNLSGNIPSSIDLIKTLEIISFDNNSLIGPVPANLNDLINLTDLYLSNNELAGPFPNRTGMKSLTNLIMKYVQLQGQVQINFSSLPNLERLLSNNKLSGIFDISSSYSDKLQLIDLQNNLISDFKKRPEQNQVNVILEDNPFCRETGVSETYCTSPGADCLFGLPNNHSPNCQCSHPYLRRLIFRVPLFLDSRTSSFLTSLKQELCQTFMSFRIPVDSFSRTISTKGSLQYNSMYLNVCLSAQDCN